MVEKVINNEQDLREFIRQKKEENSLTMRDIEKGANVSIGYIGKWKNNSPSLNNILKILKYLGIELVVRPVGSSSEQENVEEELDVVMIKALLQKILKKGITDEEKERLYRILLTFL